MLSLPPRFRSALLASACATVAITAHADVLTEFTLTADNATIGEAGFAQSRLLDSTFRDEGFSAGSIRRCKLLALDLDAQRAWKSAENGRGP